jgi:hypothetical protein
MIEPSAFLFPQEDKINKHIGRQLEIDARPDRLKTPFCRGGKTPCNAMINVTVRYAAYCYAEGSCLPLM